MSFNYNQFTLGQKWSSTSVNYTLTDASRAISKLSANPLFSYDATYGIKPLGSAYSSSVASAFQELTKPINLGAFEDRASPLAQVNITFSVAKNLMENGQHVNGVKFGDPATGQVAIVLDQNVLTALTPGKSGFTTLRHLRCSTTLQRYRSYTA